MRRGNPPWLPWADTEVRPYDQICLEEIPIFNTLKLVLYKETFFVSFIRLNRPSATVITTITEAPMSRVVSEAAQARNP